MTLNRATVTDIEVSESQIVAALCISIGVGALLFWWATPATLPPGSEFTDAYQALRPLVPPMSAISIAAGVILISIEAQTTGTGDKSDL